MLSIIAKGELLPLTHRYALSFTPALAVLHQQEQQQPRASEPSERRTQATESAWLWKLLFPNACVVQVLLSSAVRSHYYNSLLIPWKGEQQSGTPPLPQIGICCVSWLSAAACPCGTWINSPSDWRSDFALYLAQSSIKVSKVLSGLAYKALTHGRAKPCFGFKAHSGPPPRLKPPPPTGHAEAGC